MNHYAQAVAAVEQAIEHLRAAAKESRSDDAKHYARQLQELLSSDGGEAGLRRLANIQGGAFPFQDGVFVVLAEVFDTNRRHLGALKMRVEFADGRLLAAHYAGKDYCATGKTGTNMASGRPMIELATINDERAWASLDGGLLELD